MASTALAQGTLVAPPQTKEEAAEAREAAAEDDEGLGISLEAALAVTGLLLLGGATWYMIRDSRHATGMDDPRRQAPPVTPSSTRGAPKTMFEGEARPGGQVGKSKKREKAKRQKQARRANRPR